MKSGLDAMPLFLLDDLLKFPYFSVSQCQTSQNGYPCKFPFRFENRSHFECVKRRGSDIPECQVDRERVSWIFIFIFKKPKFNLHWHELWKQEKCSSLSPPRGIFYKTQWAWQGVKLAWLMSIFSSKSSEIFDKNSADKIWSIKDKGWKGPSLMPIRVKVYKL